MSALRNPAPVAVEGPRCLLCAEPMVWMRRDYGKFFVGGESGARGVVRQRVVDEGECTSCERTAQRLMALSLEEARGAPGRRGKGARR